MFQLFVVRVVNLFNEILFSWSMKKKYLSKEKAPQTYVHLSSTFHYTSAKQAVTFEETSCLGTDHSCWTDIPVNQMNSLSQNQWAHLEKRHGCM